jgi:hypothetical protein
MPTVSEIRTALKTRLASNPKFQVYATVPGQINPPAGVIRRRSGPRPSTLGATNHDYTFTVTVLTSLADDKSAQLKLDEFLSGDGAASVMEAIDEDPTLNGVVDYAQVSDIEEDRVVEVAGVNYIGADVVIEVGA